MLALSRRRYQRILAGPVEITVLDIRGDNVRIGIKAPITMPVNRDEVLKAICIEDPAKLEQLGYEFNALGLIVPRAFSS